MFSSGPTFRYLSQISFHLFLLFTARYGLVMTKKPAQKPATKASNVFGNDSSDEDEDGSVRKVNASLKKPGWVTKEVHCRIKTLPFLAWLMLRAADLARDLNEVNTHYNYIILS